MTGLVLEGGTFRPIFSSGVMDALLKEDILLPYCIGVSAGISDAYSYISRQIGRNLQIVEAYRNDGRYLGARNLLRCRSVFGLDFVFDEIPNRLIPFDMKTFLSYTGRFVVGVTNARTGKSEYLNGLIDDNRFAASRATCAMPLLFPSIRINGQKYYDGGVADPIPAQKALSDGCDRLILVLTQPRGYKKRLGRQTRAAARLLGVKYPALAQTLLERHLVYNRQVEFCESLEKEGRALILRPAAPLDSFEKDVSVLRQTYQQGFDLCAGRMDEIRAFIGRD
jgi:predicted patatin/cPLA2 family phospholipase